MIHAYQYLYKVDDNAYRQHGGEQANVISIHIAKYHIYEPDSPIGANIISSSVYARR